MKHFLISTFALAMLSLVCIAPRQIALGQSGPTASSGITKSEAPVDVNRIIHEVAAKETQFHQALNNYAFKRDTIVQTIGFGGQVTGEFHRVSSFTFDDSGHRYEKIIFSPQSTLTEITVSQEDLDDLGGIEPYALEASKIDQYSFTYLGKEHIDELDTYVFDVGPKVMPRKNSKDRFFQGRIWIDDRDLQIVKVRGKAVPDFKDQFFPIFESYREQIDGRYWFPTYVYADEEVELKGGTTVHFRLQVRYTDYGRFRSGVKIIEEGDEPEPSPTAPPPSKPKP